MGKAFRSYADSRGIQFLKIIISVAFIFSSVSGFPQMKEPVVPNIPDIDLTGEAAVKIKTRITIYGSSMINGELIAGQGLAINGSDGRLHPLDEIWKIKVQKWAVKKDGRNLIFYPDEYEVLLKNQTKITVSGNIEFLNRMKVNVNNKQKIFYTFFYDYYKNGRWINSGIAGYNHPADTPAKGTAYIIELN